MTDAAFLDRQIGFYRRANGKRPWREERLGAVLEMIRNGDLWKPGDRLLVGLTAQAMARAGDLEAEWAGSVAPAEEGERDNPAHAEYYRRKDFYGELKNGKDSNTLSAATFGGIFDGCRDSGMRSHSGLIGADLDHLNRQGRSAAEVRDQAMQMPYVAFAFISPSQDGVKVHCLVDPAPTNRGEQTAAWEQVGQQLTKDLGLEVTTNDPKAKNLARICFLGYDPDIGIADSAALLAMHVDLKPKAPPAKERRRTRARAAIPPTEPNEESVEGEYVALPGRRPREWLEACPWLQERGTQLEGKCPECGGDDRFHVNLERPYLYHCRKCNELSRSSWPWYAAFRPWYRDGDFTGSGRGPWECSPDADCLRLVRRYADQLLLVDEEEKGKFHLRVDNGYGVWRDADARLTTLILLTTREWHRASADAGLERATASAVARWAVATARMKSRNEALDSVSTIAGWLAETGSWPQGLTRARRSDLDRPGAPYVGAPNGVINLETRQVLTGAAAREKLVTRTLLDPYDETAKHPAVDQLLSHLTPENREWLLGAAGWGLRGNPARRFYFLEGLGNDGKTTLFNALLETLGDYAAPPMSNSMFNGGRNGERPDAPMAYLKTFQEVPLVFIAEPPKNGFNWELARTVSGSDTTNARQIRGKLDVLRKRRYISTLFLCTNPDTRPVPPPMVTSALYDRFRLLKFPQIPASERDIDMPRKLSEPMARQALAALVIAHARRNLTGPPEDSPDVALTRDQIRRESLGEMGAWATDHIVHTSDQSVVLTTDEIWEAAKAAVPEASGDLVWGMTRRQLIDFLKLMLEVPPSRGRVRGKITHYWKGYRLRSDEEIEQDEGQPLPGPLAYCRICKILFLECRILLQAHQHVEATPSEPFLCFLCGEPMPGNNPLLLTCSSCDRVSNAPGNPEAVLGTISRDMGCVEVRFQVEYEHVEE